ncbi:MAG: glycosyltransferase family 2 protein [Candidatus Omnitrophica bacterium]|nr:glycosyltransferase family 2 protein [Candidatus Omnitrophota bacterium]
MKISILLIARDEERFIARCLESLLRQGVRDFELIVLDNGSTDGTAEAIRRFNDTRIRYITESFPRGLGALRNRAVGEARGKYIFFTDADCVPHKNWLAEGLAVLEKGGCVGVEGRTFYEAQGRVTIADGDVHQFVPGEYMTCNCAYTREALETAGFFDPAFIYGHEDRDLGWRIAKLGKICFAPDMLVTHQRRVLSVKTFFDRARRAEDMVRFLKKHGGYPRVLYPRRLLMILFPPLLLLSDSYMSPRDLLFFFIKYAALIYERLLIWKEALRNKVVVL